MKITNKVSFYIVLAIFLVFIGFIYLSEVNLKKHGILLNGTTTDWGGVVKGYDLNYKFIYKGEIKTGNNAIEKIRGLKVFENKHFPIIYEPEYGVSQILIDPATFKKYDIPFPDSLNWVLPYFK